MSPDIQVNYIDQAIECLRQAIALTVNGSDYALPGSIDTVLADLIDVKNLVIEK